MSIRTFHCSPFRLRSLLLENLAVFILSDVLFKLDPDCELLCSLGRKALSKSADFDDVGLLLMASVMGMERMRELLPCCVRPTNTPIFLPGRMCKSPGLSQLGDSGHV